MNSSTHHPHQQPINRGLLNSLIMPVLLVFSGLSSAVQLNPEGTGQVLIYPFYSVNNNLNTAYAVVNTTDQAKAVKVTFRESEAGLSMLSFNVYLGAYDVWTGGLIPATSTDPDHTGEPSVLHLTADGSCAPFLDKSGVEFSPALLDQGPDQQNNSLARARTGHIEVLEMGTLNGQAAEWVNRDFNGDAPDCEAIEAGWDQGEWTLEPTTAPTGGILGSGFVVNVASGVSFSFDAVALDNFWGAEHSHTEPGSALPDLSSGMSQSTRLMDDGQVLVNQWDTGYEAVSAALINTIVFNEYALDIIVNGQTEWVINYPTKHHHVEPALVQPVPPFSNLWSGHSSCESFFVRIRDRSSQVTTSGRPIGFGPRLCVSTNVMSFILPGGIYVETSPVLGSDSHISVTSTSAPHATENGWAQLEFSRESQLMMTPEGIALRGLPVTGFAVQQFHNAGAGEGLLARYGSVFAHKYQLLIYDFNK